MPGYWTRVPNCGPLGSTRTWLTVRSGEIQPLNSNQPWGESFAAEFKAPDAFVTGRGMVGPLRQVFRGLVPSRRKGPAAKSWNREHLLFFCTYKYEHYCRPMMKLGARLSIARPKSTAPRPNWKRSAPIPTPPDIGEVARDEVLAIIREVFGDGQPRGREDAVRDIARALGYRRVGGTMSEVLSNDIRTAVRRGVLDNSAGQFSLLCRTIDGYTRDHLVDILLAAIGPAWCDREEAIVAAARHLGFRRTGTNIRTAFKSATNAAIRRGLIEADGQIRIRRVYSNGTLSRTIS